MNYLKLKIHFFRLILIPGMCLYASNEAISQNCTVGTSKTYLDINNVRAVLLNAGDLWFDLPTNPGYQVSFDGKYAPHSIFAGTLWFAGRKSDSSILITAQTYRQGIVSYWPGPIETGTPPTNFTTCSAFDRHFKVNRSEIDAFRLKFQNGQVNNAQDIPQTIRIWPGRLNPHLPVLIPAFSGVNMNLELAPFVDVNNDGIYNPMNGDYPQIKGDQSVWWVMNDKGNIKQMGGVFSPGIGLEIQVMAYAWDMNGNIDNTTVYDYKVIHKGTDIIYSSHIGHWVDPDVGWNDNNLVGSEVKRGIGYVYKRGNFDSEFGLYPPTLGFTYIYGVQADPFDGKDNNYNGFIDEIDEDFQMSSFGNYSPSGGSFINGSPSTPLDYYNYLLGRWKNLSSWTFDFATGTTPMSGISPVTGQPPICETRFLYPGFSDTTYGIACGGGVPPDGTPNPNQNIWSEITAGNPPGNRRITMSMGSFTFMPGQTKEFTLAVVSHKSRKDSANDKLNDLFEAVDEVRCFLRGGCLQSDFRGPKVSAANFASNIKLSLQPDTFAVSQGAALVMQNTEQYDQTINGYQYKFQGYQIFQVRDKTVTIQELDNPNLAKLVAQCDLQDTIVSLSNVVKGSPVLMVQGANQGIQHQFTFTQNAFTQQPLKFTGPIYYMAVAYAASPGNPTIQYLRSTKGESMVEIRPESIVFNGSVPTIPVRKESGQGSGLTKIEMEKASVDSILKDVQGHWPKYLPSAGPVSVLVTDPATLSNKEYKLEMLSYLEYENGNSMIQEGDTILSVGDYSYVISPVALPIVISKVPQNPGLAVVEHVLSSNASNGKLVVRMIGDNSGTFTRKEEFFYDLFTYTNDTFSPQPFICISSAFSATATFFANGEFWRLTDLSDSTLIYAEIPFSWEPLQVIPSLGMSILSNGMRDSRPFRKKDFEILHRFTRRNTLASQLVPVEDATWMAYSDYESFPVEVLSEVSKQGWMPYPFTQRILGLPPGQPFPMLNGPCRYNSISGANSLTIDGYIRNFEGNNIMLVLTNDTSKWSRVPVLQYRQKFLFFERGCLLKSYLPSVNKLFQIDTITQKSPFPFYANLASRGMSWFPGYAIDLDKGERLHLMFSEDRNLPNGENLQWEPDTNYYGGNSHIFLTNLSYHKYDLERSLDSLVPLSPAGLPIQNNMALFYSQCITWVGNFRKSSSASLSLTDTFFVSIDKPYRNLNTELPAYRFGTMDAVGIPEYRFSRESQKVTAYPNPTHTELYFKHEDESVRLMQVFVYDLAGVRISVSAFPSGNEKSLSVSYLSGGTYIYVVVDDSGRTYPGKFVKQ